MMSCPTCGHTMGRLCVVDDVAFFHCERCGTAAVKTPHNDEPYVYAPKLVERCREFQRLHRSNFDEFMGDDWQRLGFAESIAKPEDRP